MQHQLLAPVRIAFGKMSSTCLDKLFETAIPLADALAAAHDRGILHRDLKPGNIMVTDAGRVKVLDFGLAKLREPSTKDGAETQLATDSITQEGIILGTAAYMSPEQAEGKEVDHRSDIFSLGVVLYEMATGARPFQGDTGTSTRIHLRSNLKSLASTAPEAAEAKLILQFRWVDGR